MGPKRLTKRLVEARQVVINYQIIRGDALIPKKILCSLRRNLALANIERMVLTLNQNP